MFFQIDCPEFPHLRYVVSPWCPVVSAELVAKMTFSFWCLCCGIGVAIK